MTASFIADAVLCGPDRAKMAYIISNEHRRIIDAVTRDMGRGVTLLRGEGGWSGSGRNVLLVAFRQRQIVALKRTVSEIDPEAFLIVCPAHEVLGNGFRRHGADGL